MLAVILAAVGVVGIVAAIVRVVRLEAAVEDLRLEVRSAAESVREAGSRLDDQFSADVSELLNYNAWR